MEWSSQFCADPAKVELLRVNARALYEAFPSDRAEDGRARVQEGAGAARHADHRCQDRRDVGRQHLQQLRPAPRHEHTGTRPTGSGEHHYPRPITNIEFIKRDDFQLWHDDPESGTPIAVVPTDGHPGTTDNADGPGRLRPARHEAPPPLRKAHDNGEILELDADHPITKAAFALQTAAATDTGA